MRELRGVILAAIGASAGCHAVAPQAQRDTDAVDTDAVDTDAVDTDAVDTDAVDTDAVDTDPADTDPVDTDFERTCEDAPLYQEYDSGHRLVCVDRDLQDCDSWALDPMGLMLASLGDKADDTSNYYAQYVCGPEPAAEDCCYVLNCWWSQDGRPFTVQGEARVARSGGSGWAAALPDRRVHARLADAWARTGAAEHASIASFARFVLELTAMAAPADLVAEATRALADEIVHARLAYGVASSFAGSEVGPGPLDPSGALDDLSPHRIVLDAVREGCIGETLAAAEAAAARDLCPDPEIREILSRIAEDEARHAALAWKFVRWALDRHPELREPVRAALGVSLGAAPAEDPDAAALAAGGQLTLRGKHRVAGAALREVVAPCADHLLVCAIAA